MSNGGQWFNVDYGGEVYYDTPSMLGALTFWSRPRRQAQGPPAGVQEGGAVTSAFLSGQASMMLLSTGSLTHIRNNAKFPYKVAFVPEERAATQVPIGGASLVIPTGVDGERTKAAWTLINWMTSPEKSGWWSRATGYFAPNMNAYDLPEMKEFLAKNPDAKVAVEPARLSPSRGSRPTRPSSCARRSRTSCRPCSPARSSRRRRSSRPRRPPTRS